MYPYKECMDCNPYILLLTLIIFYILYILFYPIQLYYINGNKLILPDNYIKDSYTNNIYSIIFDEDNINYYTSLFDLYMLDIFTDYNLYINFGYLGINNIILKNNNENIIVLKTEKTEDINDISIEDYTKLVF